MKRQRIQLILLLILLVVLGAGFLGVRQYNKIQSEKPAEVTGDIIVDIDRDSITKFSYDYDGENYTFVKDGDTWYYDEDRSLSIKQTYMTGMLTGLAEITAQETYENVTDMSQYGLDSPSRTLSYETADASYIFYVGDHNEISGVYYLSKPSETTVYVVSSQTITRFNKSLEDVVETPEETIAETTEETIAETTSVQ